MTPRSNIILWLVATVAVAALTALAVNRRLPPPKPDSAASSGDPAGLSLHEWMHQHLEVTPAQHAVLDPLERAYETERLQLRQQIRQLGSELARAVRDAAPSGTILATQEKLNAAQGQLQQATLKHFLEMKQHLTPAQAEKLAAWTHDSLLLQPAP
jgi:Spy/CpxP family protein refolding chaperone